MVDDSSKVVTKHLFKPQGVGVRGAVRGVCMCVCACARALRSAG